MLTAVRSAGVRTLVVAGEIDRLVKEAAWRQVASLSGASVEVITGAGHVPHEERPDEFVAVVQRFLSVAAPS
jgi:pimeloyl-ACP methyl ester carboxylesterase